MNDSFYRMLFFGLFNLVIFAAVYLFGRKWHPELALWLCVISFLVMTTLCYFSMTWIGLSTILSLVYLGILKKPNHRKEFQGFFTENKIYAATGFSQPAMEILGDKKWRFAEGSITPQNGHPVSYSFWQGSTSSTVSTGQYNRSTVHTYYIAFIFPPGSVSKLFKQHVMVAADTSAYSWKEKLKYFFRQNLEKPNLVATASDGSFIIQYYTNMDIAHYRQRLQWIKNNLTEQYYPITKALFTGN